ncbi:MAG: Ig-like domain-containing protein, partial [Actinobacteria bacterium]|nr:Ig-like domain-containing protein [Actinomycetota bacterium]
RILIYRPQLTFDSAGNPIFGFVAGRTYILEVPGTRIEPLGPHIRSTSGSSNSSHLECALVASQGINDARPGHPRVNVTVDRVTGYDANGDPISFEFNVPAQDAENVYRATPIRMVFDDVMNPGTLANPVTGFSTTILPFVDADGDITTDTDRVPLRGTFRLTIDQSALRTTVIFTPAGGLPSAGSDVANPRRILVVLSPQITDLGGNQLINPQTVVFTSEMIEFDPIVIDELFADGAREDAQRTGSVWGGGLSAPGLGGGSGRLGDLIVLPGVVVELDTDSEDFSGIGDPAVFNPINIIDRPANLVVTGGAFEFSRLRIDAGGILRFRGSRPARLFVRGEAVIQGLVDVSGGSGILQNSSTRGGGPGGTPGPNGGAGGRGGSRPDGSAFLGIGGVA